MRRSYGRDECGEVSSWLVQLVVMLTIVGLVVFELVALGMATVRVDEVAREVARTARDEYRAASSLDRAEAVAREAAERQGATLVAVEADQEVISVTLEKQASTLLVHRIGPLAERVTPSATRSARLRP
jgi:hypothetical protein